MALVWSIALTTLSYLTVTQAQTTIPTRMTSLNSHTTIQNILDNTNDNIFVSNNCFDTTSTPLSPAVSDNSLTQQALTFIGLLTLYHGSRNKQSIYKDIALFIITMSAYSMTTTHGITLQPTSNPTTAAPTGPGCSGNYAFVEVESSSGLFKETLTSLRVDFPPYAYLNNIIHRRLVLFGDGAEMTENSNNPCDHTTWTDAPADYNGRIVMINYNDYFVKNCSIQQWTLNLEEFADVKAVLVANNKDLYHVWSIEGDTTLKDPKIPTRMISQVSAQNIRNEMNRTGENIFVDIDCFDTAAPTVICVLDKTNYGVNVALDGEYQQQSNTKINGHPVWLKEGMDLLWDNMFIWLYVDHDATNSDPWRWVIGTNYNDSSTIFAQCILTWSSEYIDDPTQCGKNWYTASGELIGNLTSNDGICDLGDSYVCADSGSAYFNYYFSGRYRQVHDGVSLWFANDIGVTGELTGDAFVGINFVNQTFYAGWAFVFAYASSGSIYAFCPIIDGQNVLQPWNCNKDWYTMAQFDWGLAWINDPLMDVDQCEHPNATNVTVAADIVYPKALCLMDPFYAYSHYQTFYGIYVLDNSTVYNNRYIYRNQRLLGDADEWNILWYETKDSWAINDGVPGETYISIFEGICRDNVDTPDLCTSNWEFYEGVESEINANIVLYAIDSTNEEDCMAQPSDPGLTYSQEITLCFHDDTGLIYPDTYSNPFTGKWKIDANTLYRNRHYWYLLDEETGNIRYFMYYEDDWRYWVIDSYFYTHQDQFDLICLRYDEYEPFNCASWYSQARGFTMTMDADCTLNPTPNPTTAEPSVSPTQHPIGQCVAQNKYVSIKSTVANLWVDQVLATSPVNFPPFASDTFYHEHLVLFEDGVPAANWTVTAHNPCNYNTWTQNTSYYNGKVVLIPYDDWFGGVSCTVQQWVWMLESYGAIGVLVSNNVDTDHVYALSGDETLYTSIPTRMISQIAGMVINVAINDYNDEVYVDFGCYDHTEWPSMICINDYNNIGNYVYLDGEYQRQLYAINDHPYYLKLGHYGLWDHMYIWLEIDRSVSGDAEWTWVIGTDYTDTSSIIAECRLNGEHIDHPGLCGNNWWVEDTLRATIQSSNSTCQLGDDYICLISTTGQYFGYWFDGQYRQVHDGVALWLMHSEEDTDSYITIGQVSNVPGHSGNPWVFAVVLNQSDIYAYCVIGDGSYPTEEEMMKPYECTDDWWVFGYDNYNNPTWYIDLGFDIDECTHSNITTTAETINYPSTLCLTDPTNTYSHYQGHYGVYRLDTTTSYDGRYVYYNQRLKDESLNWYIMWYEEKDAWVLNEYVPAVSVVHNQDGICREDVSTPDECSACWEFYEGFEWQNDCNIQLTTMSTTDEVDCMPILAETVTFDLTYTLSLCFDDGYYSDWDNVYSGKFYTHDYLTYNGRNYWYRQDEYGNKLLYIFYDEIKRFWVIDSSLGSTDYSQWHWYCLDWHKFEPFDCDTWYSTNWNWTMSMTTCAPSVSPTPSPTNYPTTTCSGRNAFVFADWTHDGILPRVLTSEYTNYAPFVYDTLINVELVLFENGRNMSEESSNPCSLSTLVEDYSFYVDKIVMIEYNELCNMERQALYMEFMGAVGVLIHNNDMTHTVSDHVYALSGDDTLGAMPTIPSRMISEYGGILLKVVMDTDETVFISFDCYDDAEIEYPSIICLVDKSINGMRVYLDGEYQRQASWFTINDHPVWLKTGYTGLWKEIWMWLMIENENGNDAWKWVIGTKYWDESTIIAVCDINGTHIEHPALCGQNWHVNGTLEKTITTSNNTCSLGDNYVCVEAAPGGLFDLYFTGQYRQIHEGVSVWLHENVYTDMYITIGTMTFPGAGLIDDTWVFSFVVNQTDVWAFCVIGDGSEPSDIEKLSPYDCTEDWYVMEFDYSSFQYYWTIDYAFDIDECTHPNITTTAVTIDYPKYLCLNDESDSPSHYQSHYGVYILDNETSFDGRNVYYNQRLKDNLHDWYILFYEEKDAWVINQFVPNQWITTVVRDHEGICREEALTPDQCSKCWEFYDRSGLRATPNCNVKLTVMDNAEEGNCVQLPVMKKDIKDMRKQQFLSFDKPFGALSGKWVLAEDSYNDRPYWYKVNEDSNVRRLLQSDDTEWYMFYDEMWRYWAIDSKLGGSLNDVLQAEGDLFCLDWRSFEPWNCSTWYTSNNQTAIAMTLVYTSAPTTDPTRAPSTEPTITFIQDANAGTGHAKKSHAIIGWLIGIFTIIGCCMYLLYICKKRRNKGKAFFERQRSASGHAVVAQGSGSPDMANIDLNMVQMYGSPSSGTGTSGINGENQNNTPISDDGSQRNLREGSELDRFDGVDGLGMTGGDNGGRKSKSKSSDDNSGSNPEALLNRNNDDDQYLVKARTSVGGDGDDLFNPNLHESGDDVADEEVKPKAWVKFSE